MCYHIQSHSAANERYPMIGMSLSLCVQDVLNGKVALSDIEQIVAGTSAPDLDVFKTVLDGYAESYWSKAPEQGVRIALELYHAGKVCQPRLANANHFPVLQNKVHWVNSVDEIVWYDAEQVAD